MSDTNFVSGTVITKEWLNDTNRITYKLGSTAAGDGASMVGLEESNGTVKQALINKAPINVANEMPFSVWLLVAAGLTDIDVVSYVNSAFSKLIARGGGELIFPPGRYYLGSYSTSVNIITVSALRNSVIRAHGATFVTNTTAAATPFAFFFVNPNNVVWDGGYFTDDGFNPSVWALHSRWGMGAIRLDATTQSSGFTVVNAMAEEVTYFVVADMRLTPRLLDNITVRDCRVKTAYYGVDCIYVGNNLKVENLRCYDVRRTVITFGAQNMDIDVKLYTSSGFIGSNAAVSIANEGTREPNSDVRNVRVRLNVSGFEAHTSYVHLYFQQDDSVGSMANVDIDVKVNDISAVGKEATLGATDIVLIDHENASGGLLGSTTRTLKNCRINVEKTGSITGIPIRLSTENTTDPFELELSPQALRLAHSYTVNQLSTLRHLTPWEKVLNLTPVGTTTSGTASGLVQTGSYCVIGKRVFFNARVTWTGHTGTGNLRFIGLPLSVEVGVMSTPTVSVIGENLTHPNNLVASLGGVGGTQILLFSELSGALTAVPIDTAATVYVSGSYVTAD